MFDLCMSLLFQCVDSAQFHLRRLGMSSLNVGRGAAGAFSSTPSSR